MKPHNIKKIAFASAFIAGNLVSLHAIAQTNLITSLSVRGGGVISGLGATSSVAGFGPSATNKVGVQTNGFSIVSGHSYTLSLTVSGALSYSGVSGQQIAIAGMPSKSIYGGFGVNTLPSGGNLSYALPASGLTAVVGTNKTIFIDLYNDASPFSVSNILLVDDADTGSSASSASSSPTFRSNTLSYLRSYASGAAGMLDSLSAAPAMSGVMTALNNLSGAAQANAIAQTLPAMAGGASLATTGSMQALNQIVQGRSNSLRGMASGDEYIGNRDVWMKGFGSWANQNDVNGVAGYKVNTGGLAIGVDQGFTPKLNIGAVLALSNSGVSSNSNSAPSGVTINSYQAGVYGDYAIEKNIIANAQADIGINQNKEYRNITFMGTNANGTYNSYSGHLGTGVKYLMPINPENTFIPSVRVDYTTVQSQAYSESGAGALNLSVAKQTYNTLIPSADVRIDHSLDSKMTLSANAGAGYNTLNNQVSATSAYAGGGTTFATNGLQVSPWLYNAGVGVTGQIDKNLQLNVRYDNVFSPTGYMNQMVSAKLKIPL
jgi:outer membrane autotransporter protein